MREIMLIVHFIGLAMGLGANIVFMFLGMATSRMEVAEAQKFRVQTSTLSRMGHIGLTLLILSGGYLMTPYWKSLSSSPMLVTKIVLALVLASLVGVIASMQKKAKQGAHHLVPRIETLGKLTLVTALVIVALAVYIFH